MRWEANTKVRNFAFALLIAFPGAAHAQNANMSTRRPSSQSLLCIVRNTTDWSIGRFNSAQQCVGFETQDAAASAIKNNSPASDKSVDTKSIENGVELAAPFATKSTNGCKTTDGAYAPTSMAFFPTCYGLFSASTARYLTYPTRGTDPVPGSNPPIPSTTTNGLAQVLIQGKTQSSTQGEQLLTLNYDVDRGAPTSASIDKVALQLYMNCHRSLDGHYRPGACWAFNPDMRFEQGAGPLFGTIAEFDMNLADEYCGPNAPSKTGCAIYSLWFNGLNLYPQTATIKMEGIPVTYRGLVDVKGSLVSAVKPFGNSLSPGFNRDTTNIYINNVMHRVQRVISPTTLLITSDLGILHSMPSSWQPHTTKDAIFITGDNYASNSVIQANTAAYYGVTLGGHNVIGLDVSRNSAQYGLMMSRQQRVTFNGFDDYQLYAGNDEHQFFQNGQVTFAIDGVRNGFNWVGAANAGTGSTPTLSARGFDANANLGLQAKGNGAVAVLSKAIALRPTTIAALPACSTKSTGWLVFVSDSTSRQEVGFNSIVVGGGSASVSHLAECDGKNWRYQ